MITLATQADAQDPLSSQPSSPALLLQGFVPNRSLPYRLLWSLIGWLGRNLVSTASLTSLMKRLILCAYEGDSKPGVKYERSFGFQRKKETKRCRKSGGRKGLICLCRCTSPRHCGPLVECDCSPDRCNDRSSWGRKAAEGGRVWATVFLQTNNPLY